jgi:superfamily II DNA helicase RecQ
MVCRYHAKLPLSERVSAHREFQRDDASVMVASLAFGMGIDKPNIRRIIHYVSVTRQAVVATHLIDIHSCCCRLREGMLFF